MLAAAPAGEEVGALDEGDARLLRLHEELTAGRPGGEFDPHEVAALRPREGRVLGQLTGESVEHRVAPLAQKAVDAFEVRAEALPSEELEHRRLREVRR